MPYPFLQRDRNVAFDEPAGRAVAAAQDEALALGHDIVGVEHFLLGLLSVREGRAAQVLADAFGLELEAARASLAGVRPHAKRLRSPLPFAKETRKVTEHAARMAEARGEPVATTDVLLGVLAAGGGFAAPLLREHAVSAAGVTRALAGVEQPQEQPAAPASASWAERLVAAAAPGWELAALEQGEDEVRAVFRRST
jgi:ATP-dependent Clp protease ATP-binding subunit ClpC